VCSGSRLLPAAGANGSVAFGQYKPSASGSGFDPWALQVLELKGGAVAEFVFFLDTERLFPLFGLPLVLTPDWVQSTATRARDPVPYTGGGIGIIPGTDAGGAFGTGGVSPPPGSNRNGGYSSRIRST
jgi:hypothetical protein